MWMFISFMNKQFLISHKSSETKLATDRRLACHNYNTTAEKKWKNWRVN
jgi:hypothetical protein